MAYNFPISIVFLSLTVIIGKVALGALIGGVAAVSAATFALPILGFGSAGVAAGSVAAGVQSLIGSVSAGSLFALLQSVGATGLAMGAKAAIATVGGLLSGLFSFFF